MYGEPTDPTPYIAGAYIIGFFLIFGYSLWLTVESKKISRYLEVIKKDK
jgi:hypothetical protein